MYIRRSDFLQVVSNSWESPIDGYRMNHFCWKLKRLKCVLRDWNTQVFGNVHDNVKLAEEQVSLKESIYDVFILTRT